MISCKSKGQVETMVLLHKKNWISIINKNHINKIKVACHLTKTKNQ